MDKMETDEHKSMLHPVDRVNSEWTVKGMRTLNEMNVINKWNIREHCHIPVV